MSREVVATSARLGKVAALAAALAAASPDEAPVVVAYLSGELPQRQIGVGWATLKNAPPPAETAALTVAEVDAAFTLIGSATGKGSTAERKRLVDGVFGRATADEQHFLVRLLSGELRQGALDGVMTDAVAKAAGVLVTDVRRAVMLSGSLPSAAQAALGGGSEALAAFGLQVGRPVKPMLAASEPTVADALAKVGGAAAIEWKLDGIRIQAHVRDGEIRLFTRTLDDITPRLPEVVAELTCAAGAQCRVRRGTDRATRRRPAATLPGHCRPRRDRAGDTGSGRGPAVGVPLRRAAPGWRRPDRPPGC